jgi:hypothetical protein
MAHGKGKRAAAASVAKAAQNRIMCGNSQQNRKSALAIANFELF